MRRLLSVFCMLILAAAVTPAAAFQINLPSGNPVLGVDIPGDWKVAATKRGIEVRSPDVEVFFWVEIYLPAESAGVSKEHEAYFARQGVEITGEAKVSQNTSGTVKFQATDFPATWQGKPTVLRYLAIDPGLPAGNRVLISFWASPDGDRNHRAAFQRILDSLGAPK